MNCAGNGTKKYFENIYCAVNTNHFMNLWNSNLILQFECNGPLTCKRHFDVETPASVNCIFAKVHDQLTKNDITRYQPQN